MSDEEEKLHDQQEKTCQYTKLVIAGDAHQSRSSVA